MPPLELAQPSAPAMKEPMKAATMPMPMPMVSQIGIGWRPGTTRRLAAGSRPLRMGAIGGDRIDGAGWEVAVVVLHPVAPQRHSQILWPLRETKRRPQVTRCRCHTRQDATPLGVSGLMS